LIFQKESFTAKTGLARNVYICIVDCQFDLKLGFLKLFPEFVGARALRTVHIYRGHNERRQKDEG
jgi:hypothetical protein